MLLGVVASLKVSGELFASALAVAGMLAWFGKWSGLFANSAMAASS